MKRGEKMEKLIEELIKKEFPLNNDIVLSEEIERISEKTIKFFENGYSQQQEQLNELNGARNEIKQKIERAKKNFRKENIKSKEEKAKFAREIIILLIELSAVSVKENPTNSISTDLSMIARIFSKGEFRKPLREMLYNKIQGIGTADKIKTFYMSCRKIFLGIAIISLCPPNSFSPEMPVNINIETLMEIITRNKQLPITEITEINIKKIEGKIIKKHQRGEIKPLFFIF